MIVNKKDMMLKKIYPIIAAHKLVISKPFTSNAATPNKIPFIKKVNKPNVKMLIGKVKNNIIGLIKAFIIPIVAEVTARTIKALNPETFKFIPFMTFTTKNKAIVFIIHLIKISLKNEFALGIFSLF